MKNVKYFCGPDVFIPINARNFNHAKKFIDNTVYNMAQYLTLGKHNSENTEG